MNEIEVKVLNIDIDYIKKKLKELNSRQIKKEFQQNYMFDYDDKRFFNNHGYVRIRKKYNLLSSEQKEKVIVTYKELISKNKYKISKEIEFESDKFNETKEFLEALSLKLFRLDEKYRESFQLAEGLVEIDTWPGVPTYLEVEAETEEKVEIILGKLGFKIEDSTSMTLAELVKFYNISNENMLFSEIQKEKFFIHE